MKGGFSGCMMRTSAEYTTIQHFYTELYMHIWNGWLSDLDGLIDCKHFYKYDQVERGVTSWCLVDTNFVGRASASNNTRGDYQDTIISGACLIEKATGTWWAWWQWRGRNATLRAPWVAVTSFPCVTLMRLMRGISTQLTCSYLHWYWCNSESMLRGRESCMCPRPSKLLWRGRIQPSPRHPKSKDVLPP